MAKKKNPGKNSIIKNQSAPLQQSRLLACEMAQLAFDRHCRDIKVLELARLSPVANHFVIATGTSSQQIRSVARELEDLGKEKDFKVFGRSGIEQGRWAVVDFVDVVVHLFDEEFRQYYDLELLWGDAPKINWRHGTKSAPKNSESF